MAHQILAYLKIDDVSLGMPRDEIRVVELFFSCFVDIVHLPYLPLKPKVKYVTFKPFENSSIYQFTKFNSLLSYNFLRITRSIS